MGNPLLELYQATGGSPAGRQEAIRRFAFAVPDDDALAAIERSAPTGVVELGAGTGYWALQLAERGVDVVAFDRAPAPSPANRWFAGSRPWYPVQAGDAHVVARFAERCLLLVWPTRNETWAAAAIQRFHNAGGDTVVYVGERPGGHTGDDLLHRLIGELDHCYHCTYGLLDQACVCGATTLFEAVGHVVIPTWHGFDDRLLILRRTEVATTGAKPRRQLLERIRSRTRTHRTNEQA